MTLIAAMKAVQNATAKLNAATGPKARRAAEAELITAEAALARAKGATPAPKPASKMTPAEEEDEEEEEEEEDDEEEEDEEDDDADDDGSDDDDGDDDGDDDEEEDEEEDDDDEESEEEEEKASARVSALRSRMSTAPAPKRAALKAKLAKAKTALATVRASRHTKLAAKLGSVAKALKEATGKKSLNAAIGAVAAMTSSNRAMVKQVARLAKSQAASTLNRIIDRAKAAGRVTPANEKAVRQMAADFGIKAARAMIKELPQLAATSEYTQPGKLPTAVVKADASMLKMWAKLGYDVKDEKVVAGLVASLQSDQDHARAVVSGGVSN